MNFFFFQFMFTTEPKIYYTKPKIYYNILLFTHIYLVCPDNFHLSTLNCFSLVNFQIVQLFYRTNCALTYMYLYA